MTLYFVLQTKHEENTNQANCLMIYSDLWHLAFIAILSLLCCDL